MKSSCIKLALFLLLLSAPFFVHNVNAALDCEKIFPHENALCKADNCSFTCFYQGPDIKYHCSPPACPPNTIQGNEKDPTCPAGSTCRVVAALQCDQLCKNWRNCWEKLPSVTPTVPACGKTCTTDTECTQNDCHSCLPSGGSGMKTCQHTPASPTPSPTTPAPGCGQACTPGQPNQCASDCPCSNIGGQNICKKPSCGDVCVQGQTQCPNECGCIDVGGGTFKCQAQPSPSAAPQCLQCANTYNESCEGDGTKTCHSVSQTSTQCDNTNSQWSYGPECTGSCGPCVHNTPQPTQPPPPPPSGCEDHRSCNCTGDNAGHCDQCGGAWCDGGYNNGAPGCHCAPERPRPTNQPPPPTATPASQPTIEITMVPTPTTNPTLAPTAGTGNKLTQKWVCLAADPCLNNSACTVNTGTDAEHRVRIHIQDDPDPRPMSGVPTYVFECLNKDGETQRCTTGNRDTDDSTIGPDNYDYLTQNYNYQLEGFYQTDGSTPADNPIPTNNGGDIGQFEWQSSTNQEQGQLNHMFLAMNEYDPTGFSGNGGTQVQGTLQYGEGSSTKCVLIRWDPSGKVYDIQSNQPVAGAKVTLFKKDEHGKYIIVNGADVLGGLENPIYTNTNGEYAFSVPEGVYRIEVTKDGFKMLSHEDLVQNGSYLHYDVPVAPRKGTFLDTVTNFIKQLKH